MATKVYMEALSPTMEEGRLVTWLKAEGDEVKEGDVLAEVETDKATMELVARGSGVLRKRLVAEGDTAAVATVIAVIGGADEDVSALTGGADAASSAPAAAKAEEAAPAPAAEAAPAQAQKPAEAATAPAEAPAPAAAAERPASAGAAPAGDGRVKASPLARRLATEAGVEIGSLQGTGPRGRIVKRDIEEAMRGGAPSAAPAAEAEAPRPAAVAASAAQEGTYRDVPVSQMRKAIAKRLALSVGPVPHFFLTVDVDMTGAAAFRARLNERLAKEKDGVKVSPNDMVVRAVASALRKHPFVNAAWQGETIRLHERVHVGVAVAVDEGLITPVIRDADRKGLAEIATEIRELAGRARERKLKPEEYTGSTFSISNLGMFGIHEFTAVLNPPEAAILAVGAIEDRVVAVDGQPAVRPRMKVTLTCDHRVVDGATGAEFLRTLRTYLEDPIMMLS